MSEAYRPSLEEVAAHAKESAKKAEINRTKVAKKRNLKTTAVITAAGVAAAAAIGFGVKSAMDSKPQLPDDRFTPERTAPQVINDGSMLTPEQIREKQSQDDQESAAEKEIAEEALRSHEVTPPAPDPTGEDTKGFQ